MSRNVLIVYYSYSTNTKQIVDLLSSRFPCEVLELKPKTPYTNSEEELLAEMENNKKDELLCELEPYDVDLTNHSLIIIATPVWYSGITPPIRTFLKENEFTYSEIALVTTSAQPEKEVFYEAKEIVPSFYEPLYMNFLFKDGILKTSKKEINQYLKDVETYLEEKPSKSTKRAIRETKRIEKHPEEYKRYTNLDELLEDLNK